MNSGLNAEGEARLLAATDLFWRTGSRQVQVRY